MADAKNEAKLIKTAREVNNYKTEWVIEKIKNAVNEWKLKQIENGELKMENEEEKDNSHFSFLNSQLKQLKVALMGLAFKPDIDDLRESPALYIAQRLTSELENVVCVEPNISNGKLKIENVELEVIGKEAFQENSQLSILNSQLKNVDIIVFLVAHKEFKLLIANHQSLIANKQILDFCGVNYVQ